MENVFINIQQAADILGVKAVTVRRLIKFGELPCMRLSSRLVRIKRVDLDNIIERGYKENEQSVSEKIKARDNANNATTTAASSDTTQSVC